MGQRQRGQEASHKHAAAPYVCIEHLLNVTLNVIVAPSTSCPAEESAMAAEARKRRREDEGRPHLLEAFDASTEAERAALWDAASDEERADVVSLLRDMKRTVDATVEADGDPAHLRAFAARQAARERAGPADYRLECGDAKLAGIWCPWAFLSPRARTAEWRAFVAASGDTGAAWRALADRGARPACQWCGRDDSPLMVCTKCRAARYCGPAHQRAHWRAGHRAACRATHLAADYADGAQMHPLPFAAWLRAKLRAEIAHRNAAPADAAAPLDEG